MDAAKDDHVSRSARRLLAQPEGIPDIIGDVLNLSHLVIVSEDNGVELFLQGKNVARERVDSGGRRGLPQFEAVYAGSDGVSGVNHARSLFPVSGPVKPRLGRTGGRICFSPGVVYPTLARANRADSA